MGGDGLVPQKQISGNAVVRSFPGSSTGETVYVTANGERWIGGIGALLRNTAPSTGDQIETVRLRPEC